MASSITARWTTGLHFEAATGYGGLAAADGEDDRAGARPTELLLTSLAACTGMDVISICHKKRQGVARYEINVTGEQTADHPRVFTRIVVEHVFWGTGLEAVHLRRAIELSALRYCPVNAQISSGDVRVIHRFRVMAEHDGTDPADESPRDVVVTGPFGSVTDPAAAVPGPSR